MILQYHTCKDNGFLHKPEVNLEVADLEEAISHIKENKIRRAYLDWDNVMKGGAHYVLSYISSGECVVDDYSDYDETGFCKSTHH